MIFRRERYGCTQSMKRRRHAAASIYWTVAPEVAGSSLVVEPYFETMVLAGGLIEDVGSPAQREAFRPQIIEGGSIWALAWAEGRSL
jgi:hypothetical protein